MVKKGISSLAELSSAIRQVQLLKAKVKELTGRSGRQCLVLSIVGGQPGLSQTGIVNLTDIDRSTLADIVRRLCKEGLLERKRTQKDERAYAVKLTAAGSKELARIVSLVGSHK